MRRVFASLAKWKAEETPGRTRVLGRAPRRRLRALHDGRLKLRAARLSGGFLPETNRGQLVANDGLWPPGVQYASFDRRHFATTERKRAFQMRQAVFELNRVDSIQAIGVTSDRGVKPRVIIFSIEKKHGVTHTTSEGSASDRSRPSDKCRLGTLLAK